MNNECKSCPVCRGKINSKRRKLNFYHCEKCGSWLAKRSDKRSEKYDNNYYQRQIQEMSMIGKLIKIFDLRLITRKLKKNGKILDLGCGDGSVVFCLRNMGWDSYGADVSKIAVKISGKLVGKERIFEIDLGKNNIKNMKFDGILCLHVLEHIVNPDSFLKGIYRQLNRGGKVIFRIPNSSSLEARIAGDNWMHWDWPYHQIMYNPQSVTKLLRRSRFKKIEISSRTWEYKQVLLYSLLQFLGINIMSQKIKLMFLPLQLIFVPLSLFLGILGNSGTLEIKAEK